MDEITKKALEAAKATKKTEKTEKTEKTLNQLELGANKIITIKPWTGKTKKKMRKIFEHVENPEEVDYIAIMKTLIYGYVNEDVYLNEGEQQFILAKLREISIDECINYEIECPECETIQWIETCTDEFLHYKTNELPFEENGIKFQDIETLEKFENTCKNIMKNDDYDGITTEIDIEIAMHIKIDEMDIVKILDYLDDLPLKETDKIIKTLRNKLPNCEMYVDRECKKCKAKNKFSIDITEDIFESLLK
jgi:hypothetical protein